MTLTAPFPWFGGKSRAASRIWQALGDVRNYVEPFAGSLATLLARPHAPHLETVNDKDGFLANFWRALAAEPATVAAYADWPVNENDLHARHAWLVPQRARLTARLEGDPAYYDAPLAGWWVWGLCCWIGGGWCRGSGPWQIDAAGELVKTAGPGDGVTRQRPHLGNAGAGVHRSLPHLGNAGKGVTRKRPHLGGRGAAGMGIHSKTIRLDGLAAYCAALAARLRTVRVACGDWSRVMSPSVTTQHGLTGVLLDPPYAHASRDPDVYVCDDDPSEQVRAWALAHGDDPQLRIVLCGYAGQAMPATWQAIPWKANGGYGSQGQGRGRANADRERLWCSPACLPVEGPA